MTSTTEKTQYAIDDLVRLTQSALAEVLRAAATDDRAAARHVLDGGGERRSAVIRARLAVQDECREQWGTRQLPRLAREMDLVAELGRLAAQVDCLARQLSSGLSDGPGGSRALRPAS